MHLPCQRICRHCCWCLLLLLLWLMCWWTRGSCTPMTTAVWLLTLDWTAVVVSTSKSKWAVCWRVGDPADCTCLKPAAGKRSWLTVAKLPGLLVDPPEERREGKLWCVFGRCWFTVDDNLMPSLGISVSDKCILRFRVITWLIFRGLPCEPRFKISGGSVPISPWEIELFAEAGESPLCSDPCWFTLTGSSELWESLSLRTDTWHNRRLTNLSTTHRSSWGGGRSTGFLQQVFLEHFALKKPF